MHQIKGYLEDVIRFNGWDKEDLNESDNFVTLSKRINNEEEIDKLVSYNYDNIFQTLHDTFGIIFKNDRVNRNELAIELNFEKADLQDYIEESLELSQYIDIELRIDKKQYYLQYSGFRDVFTNFNFFPFIYGSNFIKWIENYDFKGLEDEIVTLEKQTIFLVEDCNSSINNNKILILGEDISLNEINDFKKLSNSKEDQRVAEWRYEQVNWVEGPKFANPDWFYFDFINSNIEKLIQQFFLKSTTNLIIPFVSNYVLHDENSLNCIINGHKKINIILVDKVYYDIKQVYFLYELYRWAYIDESTDKMSIARNLITISLCDDCGNDYYSLLLQKSNNIYNTAIKNFEVYISKNIEKFFEARQKVMDTIETKSTEISNQIMSTIGSISKTLIAFLGAIFTSIIGFIQNPNIDLIKIALIAFIIYVIIYGSYYLSYSKIRVLNISKYYKEDIEKINNNLLGFDKSDEKNEILYYDRIRKNIKIFNFYWITTIVINLILILIAYCLIKNSENVISIFNTVD